MCIAPALPADDATFHCYTNSWYWKAQASDEIVSSVPLTLMPIVGKTPKMRSRRKENIDFARRRVAFICALASSARCECFVTFVR